MKEREGYDMAHMTNKKRINRDKNNKKRCMDTIRVNLGTISMGFTSNQDRKAYSHAKAHNYQ